MVNKAVLESGFWKGAGEALRRSRSRPKNALLIEEIARECSARTTTTARSA